MFTDELALISVSINFSVQSKLAATYIRSGGWGRGVYEMGRGSELDLGPAGNGKSRPPPAALAHAN